MQRTSARCHSWYFSHRAAMRPLSKWWNMLEPRMACTTCRSRRARKAVAVQGEVQSVEKRKRLVFRDADHIIKTLNTPLRSASYIGTKNLRHTKLLRQNRTWGAPPSRFISSSLVCRKPSSGLSPASTSSRKAVHSCGGSNGKNYNGRQLDRSKRFNATGSGHHRGRQ